MKKRNRIRKAAGGALCLVCLLFLLPEGVSAAEENCFPACAWDEASLVDGLRSVGAEYSFDYRAEIALANGYREY